jgi:hypothetical protein
MSTLLIDELYSGIVITQNIRVSTNQSIAYIRPWIYKQGTLVDGSFRCQVYDGVTLLKQVDIPYTTINSEIPASYAHGYIRFDVSPLPLNVTNGQAYQTYTLKFSMVSHTTNTSNYLAICRDWESPKYPVYDGPILDDTSAPYGIELFNYSK